MTDLNKERELCNQSFEKYWDDFCEAYGNGFDKSLAKLFFANAWGEAKAQAVPVWISTDFMLPDDHDYVDILINAERRIVDAVYLDGKFFIFPPFSKEQWTEVNNKVTHWMPRVEVTSESGAEG